MKIESFGNRNIQRLKIADSVRLGLFLRDDAVTPLNLVALLYELSRCMTRQNQQNDLCAQRRL